MKNIIIVEDDLDIRELIVYALNNSGYNAAGVSNSKEFFRLVDSVRPSLVILDIMLDGEDGYTILKRIRTESGISDIPVMMLTAKSSEFDKVKGLDMGADDYMTKPFGVMELVSRVKALLRRSGENTREIEDELIFEEIKLDLARRQSFVNGEEIELTYKEFELLKYLIINKELVISRDKLLRDVWGYDFEGESRTIDVHVKSLRKKLGDYAKYLQTVRNVGYKLGGINEE